VLLVRAFNIKLVYILSILEKINDLVLVLRNRGYLAIMGILEKFFFVVKYFIGAGLNMIRGFLNKICEHIFTTLNFQKIYFSQIFLSKELNR
jgi:hypothetical protein